MSIKYINGSAFEGCSSLPEINLPDSVVWIGDAVFKGCKKLKTVNLPCSVKKIGRFTFENCTSLEVVLIPEGVELIDNFAFRNCHNLKSINFPNSLKTISDFAFDNTSIKYVDIGKHVEDIEERTFYGCNKLEAINVVEGNHRYKSYNGVLFDKDFHILYRYPIAKEPTTTRLRSANNLYLTYKREFNIAPGERRQQLRQEGYMGKYKL